MIINNDSYQDNFSTLKRNIKVAAALAFASAITGALILYKYKSITLGPVSAAVDAVEIEPVSGHTGATEARNFNKSDVLNDYKNIISDDFKVPEALKDRVGFWFDIYTVYDSNKKVIHDIRRPWIIFKVVDVSPIIDAPTPSIKWLRVAKSEKFTANELSKIKNAISEIAKTGKAKENNEYHQAVVKALEAIPGDLKQKAKNTADNVRIQTGQKNFFENGIETSPLYLPGIEEIFARYKLPLELTRIPFVESSFNRHAVSKVGASGIWQFMDYTGKRFLTVNSLFDERNSPLKASEAAARLLKENHKILFKSWPLAITAWNHGPTGLRKAVLKMKTQDISQIVSKYQTQSFEFASSNFYCEFLAALYAEKYHKEIYRNLQYERNLSLRTAKLTKSIAPTELLRRSGLSKNDFVLFNPELKRALDYGITIPAGYKIVVDSPSEMALKGVIRSEGRQIRESKISQSEVSYNTGRSENE